MDKDGTPPKLKRRMKDAEQVAKEALTCAVCLELIRPPIQQCPEGHAICDSCFSQLPAAANRGRRCPTCRTVYPGKRIRNLIADQMAELLCYPCVYAKRGCKHLLPPSELEVHIKTCSFDPNRMRCPVCSWVGQVEDFKGHLSEKGIFHIRELRGQSTPNSILVEETLRMEMINILTKTVEAFDRMTSPVFFFADEVFALHAVKYGETFRIGVRQVSPCKSQDDFSSTLLVEGSSELDSVVRKCSQISTASSEEALMKETKCLSLDMDTVRSLCVPKKCFFEGLYRPTLQVKCKVIRKSNRSS